ncbi:MAG: TIGR03905 family TSCPD domain-containing protein [Bacillota bacterium]
MTGKFRTAGVCSKEIIYKIENNVVRDVVFISGCPGNLQGISRLVDGMEVHEAIRRLKGIKCGHKDTSCPDQLAHALEEALNLGASGE